MATKVVFKEKEFGRYFTAQETTDEWALSHGLTHEYVSEGGYRRYLKLLKTVAYVAVDEADDGSAVLERWEIKVILKEAA